uniref:Uncharacterized protein n=1 Tax=Meloidogyne javanica TaxID=6303 RepID=A0A915LKG4_MELJA
MVGCWLPKGYNQIQFRITQGDEQNRFGVKSQRLEQTSGWLRTFAPLDSLKLPTNITLEVKIEDRASRLQNSNKELNSISPPNLFNIRNKAFAEIQILDGNEKLKQPKLIFRQIYFQPILEHPVPVALIELFDKDLQNKENLNIQLSRLNTQFIW